MPKPAMMKILSLNCQRAYQQGLDSFLRNTLDSQRYDFLLLQEAEQKVVAFLDHSRYRFLLAFNEEAGEDAQVCIVHKYAYPVIGQGYRSFSSMRNDPWRGRKHPSFGFLWGEFDVAGTPWRFGSIHLHSGIDRKARAAELALAKNLLLELPPMHTVFGGDSNAGFPGESAVLAKLLEPEFAWASRSLGPTLDSRYSENVPHLPNRIAAFLSFFNVKIPLWTDQVFCDSKTAIDFDMQCRVLPDRVSDHSPVELLITPTSADHTVSTELARERLTTGTA